MLRDVAVGLAATISMYLPVLWWPSWLGGWSLYTYWVVVASLFTIYALARLNKRMMEVG